jgi:hypothetical protein
MFMIAFSAPAWYIIPLCIRISMSGAGAQGFHAARPFTR